MKTVVTISAAALLLSSAALAQSVGEKTGVNSTLGISPTTADFVKEAAMSDMLEIESSKIAQQKGDADEKKFAGQMITDHTKTSSELKSIVSSDIKTEIPTSLDSSSQSKLDKLKNVKPEDFRGQYDAMQVSAHKEAVSLFERYSKGGDNPKLKDWAGKTLPALGNGAGNGQEAKIERSCDEVVPRHGALLCRPAKCALRLAASTPEKRAALTIRGKRHRRDSSNAQSR
jgi:putative membrane protein